jgi:hypothetical protein
LTGEVGEMEGATGTPKRRSDAFPEALVAHVAGQEKQGQQIAVAATLALAGRSRFPGACLPGFAGAHQNLTPSRTP